MGLITVAAVTLHTLPLSFLDNRDAILDGIRAAKKQGATVVTTPELCLPGYGCLDHHLESDTFQHSWEMLAEIIQDPACRDIIVDVGMGVRHRNVRYNSRVIFTYGRILMIRPKQSLANDNLYREARFFTPWTKLQTIETYYLEEIISRVTGQKTVPIGDAILSTIDTSVAAETCEELFVPSNPSIAAGLNGAEIICNSSASHAELRKLGDRLNLIANSTRKLGGAYLYSNATGVDGEARMAFDGASMIILNGKVLAQEEQFSLLRSSVVTATFDLEEIRSYRSSHSRNIQAANQSEFPRIEVDLRLSRSIEDGFLNGIKLTQPKELKLLDPYAEIWMSTAVWLWQYLCTTNAAGFLLPLSGGADSCTTALIVLGMAKLVMQYIERGDTSVLKDLRRLTGEGDFLPNTPQEILARLFHTVYMGTIHSGNETRSRAKRLAEEIGAFHSDTNINDAVDAHAKMLKDTLGFVPKFTSQGGTPQENLSLQNVQARTRMVFAYNLAQLSTTARDTARKGSSLLVLGSANVDEILRGYLTKYDCSSADINPIGSISKTDVRAFIGWAMKEWDLPILQEFISATPSAELIPRVDGVEEQSDEVEMGLTYEELSVFGLLRKVNKLGPWSCYLRLLNDWSDKYTPQEVAEKVMRFFRFYAMNRHKSVVITPSLHLSGYSPDDNRHDERPFLYNISWPLQFGKIKEHVAKLEKKMAKDTSELD